MFSVYCTIQSHRGEQNKTIQFSKPSYHDVEIENTIVLQLEN